MIKTVQNQPRNDCFKSCKTTRTSSHIRANSRPAAPNRVLYKPSRKSQQKTSQSDFVIHGGSFQFGETHTADPDTQSIFRSYEHVTSVRNNSLDPSFFFSPFTFLPFLSPFLFLLALVSSGDPREPAPLVGLPMLLRRGFSLFSLSLFRSLPSLFLPFSLCLSTVYMSNTPFQSLTDLVEIASPNIRGHVLSSNDPNRNYFGPPTELDPQRCLLWFENAFHNKSIR